MLRQGLLVLKLDWKRPKIGRTFWIPQVTPSTITVLRAKYEIYFNHYLQMSLPLRNALDDYFG